MKGKNKYYMFLNVDHVCYACGSRKTTHSGKGKPNWFLNYDQEKNMLCHYCYGKYVYYPKNKRRMNDRLYRYGSLPQIRGWGRTLKGRCSICPNNIYDGSCKTTHMHHRFYVKIFPWFGREEICASCHAKDTWKSFICMKTRTRR